LQLDNLLCEVIDPMIFQSYGRQKPKNFIERTRGVGERYLIKDVEPLKRVPIWCLSNNALNHYRLPKPAETYQFDIVTKSAKRHESHLTEPAKRYESHLTKLAKRHESNLSESEAIELETQITPVDIDDDDDNTLVSMSDRGKKDVNMKTIDRLLDAMVGGKRKGKVKQSYEKITIPDAQKKKANKLTKGKKRRIED